ncbi:MAG: sigma-54-dependent Fis family transcriptional regulator [Chitinispirillaceae bacterium]|nr:sigma-54-dependent Fis family transcriptional regulator [Chitinispirillaceae bacterium]
MERKMHILVVDDESAIRESLLEILEEEGYDVHCAESAAAARLMLSGQIDLVLLDIKLGADNGIDLLREIKAQRPFLPVIMISGHGTVALTAEAFKLGAHEFMEKPLRLMQVRACVRNALEAVRLKSRVLEQERARYPRPVYQSSVMKRLFQQATRLASLREPVIITGPSGSGKELVAHALHYEGVRREGPFFATNAASMPVTLAEDELFGHEKGAFTDAGKQRIGCIETAHGGTLFLDEIADLNPQIQAKLLRVLETGSIVRLGATQPVKVDVRFIAVTHKNLAAMVDDGTFRHDLWYRLCAFVLNVPALSERTEDIAPLAASFLGKICAELGCAKTFAPDALAFLQSLPWPGNVRELRHTVTRAVVFSDCEVIDRQAIAAVVPAEAADPVKRTMTGYDSCNYREAREKFEKDYFQAVLERAGGNITMAAAAIGMAQSNLSRKLKELGLR